MPWRWITLGLILGCIASLRLDSAYFFDDAFIHIRLAEHLLSEGAPYFNHGIAYKTGSSSGYLYMLAPLLLWLPPIQAIIALEAATIILTFGALGWLAGIGTHRTQRIFAILAVIPFFLQSAYTGMETSIACLMMAAATLGWHYGRTGLTLFFLALAACIRIECAALLVMLLLKLILERRLRFPHLWALLSYALILAADLYFYGSIIPAAAIAKSIAYHFPLDESIIGGVSFGLGLLGQFITIFLLFSFCNRILPVLKERRLQVADCFLGFSLCVIGAWAISRSMVFEWYRCLPVFALGMALLLYKDVSRTNNILLIALGWALVIGTLTMTFPAQIRVTRYITIAEALNRHCPSCTLLSSEIGGLGYGFKGTFYDAMGLADPEAISHHPMQVPGQRKKYSIGAIPPAYAEAKQADLIVSMPVFSEALRASSFIANYTKYSCPLGGSSFGDTTMDVFSKKPLPDATLKEMNCAP